MGGIDHYRIQKNIANNLRTRDVSIAGLIR